MLRGPSCLQHISGHIILAYRRYIELFYILLWTPSFYITTPVILLTFLIFLIWL